MVHVLLRSYVQGRRDIRTGNWRPAPEHLCCCDLGQNYKAGQKRRRCNKKNNRWLNQVSCSVGKVQQSSSKTGLSTAGSWKAGKCFAHLVRDTALEKPGGQMQMARLSFSKGRVLRNVMFFPSYSYSSSFVVN